MFKSNLLISYLCPLYFLFFSQHFLALIIGSCLNLAIFAIRFKFYKTEKNYEIIRK